MKNGVIVIDGQYKVTILPIIPQCNVDEGKYTTTAYSSDPSLTTGGDLIAAGTLTIRARPLLSPYINLYNLTNSTRSSEVWTDDFIKIKLRGQFLNENQPVELCHLRSAQTMCNFASSYTSPVDGSWEFVYQVPTIPSMLGKSEDWLRINGVESNHYPFLVTPRPNDPSIGVTCYINQSRPHADVLVGDKVIWTILSRPKGYRAYWYGSKNNITDASGLPTGHISNNEWLSEAYLPDSVGNYTRWVQFRDKANNYVCTSNAVIFSVINSPASSSLMIKSLASSVPAPSKSLFGNLLTTLLKLLKQ